MIYLIKQEARKGTYFKVGFTTNLEKRIGNYYGHNPNAIMLEFCLTYSKTQRELETEIHNEILHKGFEFVTTPDGKTREWFFVPMDKEQEFEQSGLSQFKSCKNRKIYKVTH